MSQDSTPVPARLIALVVAGLLTFNYPLLSLVVGYTMPFGIPAIYLYLLAVWLLFILLLALALRGSRPAGKAGADDQSDRPRC